VDILAYSANHNGDMLTSETDSSFTTQISRGPASAQTPLLVPGTPLYIADRTTRFDIQRGSLSDSGVNIVQVNYNEVDTLRPATGLFRGDGKGLSEKIASTLDRLPGYPSDPFIFRSYGITADGTAWFTTTLGLDNSKYVLWKQKPYGPIENGCGFILCTMEWRRSHASGASHGRECTVLARTWRWNADPVQHFQSR
jgi:hypothetical protein